MVSAKSFPRIARRCARLLLPAALAIAGAAAHCTPLLACGGNEIRVYEVSADHAELTWQWSARDEHGLPEAFRTGLLDKIDECRPVLGGAAILMTASTNGVALIDRQTGKALFWARVAVAHSAEMLPGRRVAVAASLAPQGNRIEVYDVDRPERAVCASELYSGHGVIWDERRSRLYALGFDAIRAYALADWGSVQPRLRLAATWPLPGKADGHDLSRLPGANELVVTVADGVWRFDPDSGRYEPFEPLAGFKNIKAISIEAQTGRIAYQQPEDSW